MVERNFGENPYEDILRTRVRYMYPPALKSAFILDIDGDFSFKKILLPKQQLLEDGVDEVNRALANDNVAYLRPVLERIESAVVNKLGLIRQSPETKISVYSYCPAVPFDNLFESEFWRVFTSPLAESGMVTTVEAVAEVFKMEEEEFKARMISISNRDVYSLWHSEGFEKRLRRT